MAETQSESVPQATHVPTSTAGGGVQMTTRCRFGHSRAPKRCIIENKRVPHRARRNQRNESGKLSEKNSALKDVERDRIHHRTTNSETSESIPVPQFMNLDPSPPLSPSGCEPSPPNGQPLSENKRPRPEVSTHGDSLNISISAPASCMRDATHLAAFSEGRTHARSRGFVCKESAVDMQRLHGLLARESQYHPNNAFLLYVNPEVEDKVDAALRNEAVHNLRFMHNAFFNLPTETFCKAVNLIDRFIVKVKVKPKYMACVATASYCAASKLTHVKAVDVELPAPETLVHITRCGGNGADLIRMEEILASKLSNDLNGVNAYDFLRTFADAVVLEDGTTSPSTTTTTNNTTTTATTTTSSSSPSVNSLDTCVEVTLSTDSEANRVGSCSPPSDVATAPISRGAKVQYNQLLKRIMTRLEIALCSLEVYRFRPVCLALGILVQTGVGDLVPLANLCGVEWADVCQCAGLVEELYEVYYRDPLPSSRRQMVWNLSRRTLFRIGYSSPTPLDTISEDYEPADDDEWLLPLLFEP